MRDAEQLMRESNPLAGTEFDPDGPAARVALDRILATPPEPPRRGRRPLARVAVAATVAAALAAAGVALWPSTGGSPDVISSAAAALSGPETILHFRTERVVGGRRSLTTEEWRTTGGGRYRELLDGGRLEDVFNASTRTFETYVAERDEIIRHTDPDWFKGPGGFDKPVPNAAFGILELRGLLERARAGDDGIELVGEKTVNGIAAYELRLDLTSELPDLKTGKPFEFSRLVYVDKERYLPVQVIELYGGRAYTTTNFSGWERLPLTPENERLLEMTPHPGAKVTVEGKI